MVTLQSVRELIRDVPDFPKPGILFKDITPLLGNPEAFHGLVDQMAAQYLPEKLDAVVSVEARGFLLGAPLAYRLGTGLVPVRKPGKLPCRTLRASYALEYGTDSLEIHTDALKPGARVLIVDDVLATGGTMAGVVDLLRQVGAEIAGLAFLIELGFLKGREKLPGQKIHSLIQY